MTALETTRHEYHNLKYSIRKEMEGISRRAKRVAEIHMSGDTVIINDDTWTSVWPSTETTNVYARVCSLDFESEEVTTLNIIAKKGAYIAPHTHDRVEHMYVIDGEYTDTTTGKVYREGDVQVIQSNQLHSLKSDYALITATWRPAYRAYLIDSNL